MRHHVLPFRATTAATLIALAFASVDNRGAANGSIAGTVSATGLSTNADIVLSLQAPGLVAKPPAEPAQLDQKGKTFIPHVLPVAKGTRVVFLNSDPIPHNVFSFDGRYDLGSWRSGQLKDHTFTTPGVFRQLCRLHPKMAAFIVVVDTPYFAKTDQTGAFTIANVPAGQYTLVTWGDKLKETRQAITVTPGKRTTVRVTLGG